MICAVSHRNICTRVIVNIEQLIRFHNDDVCQDDEAELLFSLKYELKFAVEIAGGWHEYFVTHCI